jgi:glycosyltransferase involved in cell wall biosynthesis
MIIIDLNYFYNSKVSDPAQLHEKHRQTSGHYKYLAERSELHVIKLLNFEGSEEIDNVHYHYLAGNSSKFWLPFQLHRQIKKLSPDMIIVHGFVFPIQLLLLSRQIRAGIVVQFHSGKISWLYDIPILKLLRKDIDGFFFTSRAQADSYIRKKVIESKSKVYEVPEGSTHFQSVDRSKARKRLDLAKSNEWVFLWVGSLSFRKDPLTILAAFLNFIRIEPMAKLYMIFQSGELYSDVRAFINSNLGFGNHIVLKGYLENQNLEMWYSAVDFFISGSHYESCGFALCEAMACGCIPIVSDIPSFRKLTGKGEAGILFEKGNPEDLFEKLKSLQGINRIEFEKRIEKQFDEVISFKAISNHILDAVTQITNRKEQPSH